MTNEELDAIRERNGRREQVVASQRRNHGHHTWWREDAPGLVAITDCATLLAELDRLRPKAEAWEAHHCPITLGEWLGADAERDNRDYLDHQHKDVAADPDRETLARMEAPEEEVLNLARKIVRRDDPEASEGDVEGMARQLAAMFRDTQLATPPEGE